MLHGPLRIHLTFYSWWKCVKFLSYILIPGNRDGIHLAGDGSKIVAEEILQVLKEADWKPSLHWKSMPTEFSEDSPYDLVSYNGESTLNAAEWTYHREIQWE